MSSSSNSTKKNNKNKIVSSNDNFIQIYSSVPNELTMLQHLLDGGMEICDNESKNFETTLLTHNNKKVVDPHFLNSDYFKIVYEPSILKAEKNPCVTSKLSKTPKELSKDSLTKINLKTIILYWYISERASIFLNEWNFDGFISNVPKTINGNKDIIKYFNVKNSKCKHNNKIDFNQDTLKCIVSNSFFKTCDTQLTDNIIYIPTNASLLKKIFKNNAPVNPTSLCVINKEFHIAIPTPIFMKLVLLETFNEAAYQWTQNKDIFL